MFTKLLRATAAVLLASLLVACDADEPSPFEGQWFSAGNYIKIEPDGEGDYFVTARYYGMNWSQPIEFRGEIIGDRFVVDPNGSEFFLTLDPELDELELVNERNLKRLTPEWDFEKARNLLLRGAIRITGDREEWVEFRDEMAKRFSE